MRNIFKPKKISKNEKNRLCPNTVSSGKAAGGTYAGRKYKTEGYTFFQHKKRREPLHEKLKFQRVMVLFLFKSFIKKV
ncbi:hypothetical protein AusDCA_0662 [Desulfitobacterium sp. AusDCA]